MSTPDALLKRASALLKKIDQQQSPTERETPPLHLLTDHEQSQLQAFLLLIPDGHDLHQLIDQQLERLEQWALLLDVNDDALEEEWNTMLDLEVESLMADLDAAIANTTPEEREAEQKSDGLTLTPELDAELTAALAAGEGDIKRYWFAQQRKKRRRGRR
jgi:hypothetical protein